MVWFKLKLSTKPLIIIIIIIIPPQINLVFTSHKYSEELGQSFKSFNYVIYSISVEC
jgi:hypothetical protein